MGEFEARAMATQYVYDFSEGGSLGRDLSAARASASPR